MLKLGSFNTRKVKETLTFREFMTNHRKAGKFPITFIFAPSRYPSGAVIFETEHHRVKFTLSAEYWKAFKDTFRIKPEDIVGVEFFFVLTDNDYGIEKEDNNTNTLIPVYEYNKSKKYFKLVYKDKTTLSEPDTVDF